MRVINPENPIESSELDGHVERDRGPGRAFFYLVLAIIGVFAAVLAAVAIVSLLLFGSPAARARDVEGKHAQQDPKMKAWFDHLASGKGLCCSFADGVSIQDVDWDTQCKTEGETRSCRYRVRLHGQWVDVPESAVITEPNKAGTSIVWPYLDADGNVQIRCFLPGSGT